MTARTSTKPLPTPRQLQLLKTVSEFMNSRCCSPSITELADNLSISRSTAFEHTTALQRKGLLKASPGRARSLKLTKRSQDLLSSLKDHNNRPDQTASGGIPLAGTVAAGLPIEAIENHDTISLKDHFAATDDVFALRIQGDSMKDANICHGDLVICRRAETASNGRIVVALIDDNEATVKTFYKEKNTIRLQPANDAYEPIFTRNCRIIAVVLGLLRKF